MFWTFFFSELRCSLVDHQRHIVPGICSISNARNTNSERREKIRWRNIQFKRMTGKYASQIWIAKLILKMFYSQTWFRHWHIKEISRKTIKLSNDFLQILVSNCPLVSILILSWISPGSLDQARHVISSESNMLYVALESLLSWSFPLP